MSVSADETALSSTIVEPPSFAHTDKVSYTATGLVFRESLSWDQWIEVGQSLRAVERCLHWWIGDWLLWGHHTFGEKFAQAEAQTGFSIETLKRDQWVASRFNPEIRHDDLTFSHHVAVASLPDDARVALLEKAVEHGMSSRDLRETVKVYKGAAEPAPEPTVVQTAPSPNGFTPRTEPSVLIPAPPPTNIFYGPAAEQHTHIKLPYPRKEGAKYEFRFYEAYQAQCACVSCGQMPQKGDSGSSIIRFQREEVVTDDSQDSGECVEVVYCLSCLFDLVQMYGVGLEVYG